MVKHVVDVLSGDDSLESIKAALVFNTAVNTGWKYGWLSCEVGRKFWTKLAYCQISFALKQAIIRSLLKNLNDATTRSQNFSEPLQNKAKRTAAMNQP